MFRVSRNEEKSFFGHLVVLYPKHLPRITSIYILVKRKSKLKMRRIHTYRPINYYKCAWLNLPKRKNIHGLGRSFQMFLKLVFNIVKFEHGDHQSTKQSLIYTSFNKWKVCNPIVTAMVGFLFTYFIVYIIYRGLEYKFLQLTRFLP